MSRSIDSEVGDLAASLRARDTRALEVLYDRVGRRAFGLAYRVLGDSGAAEDAVQEAFLTIWNQADRLDSRRGNVESLLMTVVHRRAIDLLRARRGRARLQPLDFDAVDERASAVLDAVSDQLTLDAVRVALEGLAPEQREAIELTYFEGLTQTEIAEATSVPLGTVKSRLRLGLARLRATLGIEKARMNCDEVRDLAAAFAVGALEPEQARAVAEHVRECSLHEELAQLRATALALSTLAPAREPPAALRERILRSAAAGAAGDAPTMVHPRSDAAPGVRRRWAWPGQVRTPYALAAVLAAVAIGLLAWNVVLLRDDGEAGALVRTVAAGPAAGTALHYLDNQRVAVLEVQGLPALPSGRVYQVWMIRDGIPQGVGLFQVGGDGRARVAFTSELRAGDTVAVTVEPAGGSELPTSEPLFAVSI